MTTMRLIPILAAALLLAACMSQPPLAEVRLVAKSFNDLNSASQPLLDDLALAERAQGKKAAEIRAELRAEPQPTGRVGGAKSGGGKGERSALPDAQRCPNIILYGGETEGIPKVQNGFCLEDSYYYSALADPPATRAFRRALAVVGNYTELLLILAEGRNLDEARGQLETIAGNVGTALEAAGMPGIGLPLKGALQALEPLLTLAARQGNAEELKRRVRDEAPKVEGLISALREFARELFHTLAEEPLERFNTQGLANTEVARVESLRIEAYRVAISNYVVLLDRYRELLKDLVAAYDSPRNPVTLARIAERSAQLSTQADAWRRSLASLRTGLN